MLSKATCIAVHTLVTILSIRPPVSSTTKEKADKVKDEGRFSFVMTKLMPRFGGSAAIIAATLHILLMSRRVISGELRAWQVLTTLSGVLGYLLRSWSFRTLDRFFTYSLTIRSDHRLVQDGPYKYLLHPSYTGLMLTGIPYIFSLAYEGYWTDVLKPLMPVPIPGLLITLGGLIICYRLTTYRVQGEEKMLSQHFGSEWKTYASQRWRFIPFIV
ncbi:hypothetical protein BG015_003706 [Linnemannia schmuckeri]|uniref:Protein-S-isoprenylcysteine O-methyltransferase n=1 Tax=Linnemannia schmuckeri TaxID=64567 RepID=A0A9P5V366_9FUNG|nr:hypothetical protein BG015_003706 [Linnemannia schmuckeri]